MADDKFLSVRKTRRAGIWLITTSLITSTQHDLATPYESPASCPSLPYRRRAETESSVVFTSAYPQTCLSTIR